MWPEFIKKYRTYYYEVRKDIDKTVLGILLEADVEFKVYQHVVIRYDARNNEITWGYPGGDNVNSIAWFWETSRDIPELEDLRERINKFRVEFWTSLFSGVIKYEIISGPIRTYLAERLPYTLSRIDQIGVHPVMSDLQNSRTFYFLDEKPVMDWISEWVLTWP